MQARHRTSADADKPVVSEGEAAERRASRKARLRQLQTQAAARQGQVQAEAEARAQRLAVRLLAGTCGRDMLEGTVGWGGGERDGGVRA